MSSVKLTADERNFLSFFWHNYLDESFYSDISDAEEAVWFWWWNEIIPVSEIHKMIQVFGKELAAEGKFDVASPVEPYVIPWADTADLRRRLLELTSNSGTTYERKNS